MSNVITTHRQIVLLTDYLYSNPQGDPDRDNAPRMDHYTGHGIITAVGIKRKLRDWLELNGHKIFVSRDAILGDKADETAKKTGIKGDPKKASKEARWKAVQELTKEYTDIRFFGQALPRLLEMLRGPVQVSMGVSVEPVAPVQDTITRQAVETAKEADSQDGGNRTMGTLHYIPYGLYRFHIYVNPHDAAKTGFTEDDYELLIKGLRSLFDNDRSSGRGRMAVRAIYEFRQLHKDQGPPMGERLLERLTVERKDQYKVTGAPARSFDEYKVNAPTVDPQFIEVRNRIDR